MDTYRAGLWKRVCIPFRTHLSSLHNRKKVHCSTVATYNWGKPIKTSRSRKWKKMSEYEVTQAIMKIEKKARTSWKVTEMIKVWHLRVSNQGLLVSQSKILPCESNTLSRNLSKFVWAVHACFFLFLETIFFSKNQNEHFIKKWSTSNQLP